MKTTLAVIGVSIALAGGASAAERGPRAAHPELLARTAPSGGHRVLLRSARTPDAAGPQQAPGVIQTNFADASHVVWFVTTGVIPKGSVMTAYIVLSNDNQLQLDTLTASDDIQPGESFALPNIRVFGDFWPQGLVTYAVVATINGTDTQAAADFPVDSSRSSADLASMVPRIESATQVLSGSDVLVSLKGAFTSDPAYVVFEDMVAPPAAIQASPGEIRVNLSKVPNFSLGYLQDLLVTVGQSGWSDTILYRYVPPAGQ